MNEYLLDLIERMDCRDELPKPTDGPIIERLVERTVSTEAWKELRIIDDASLIQPMCDILGTNNQKVHVFDNGVKILGYLIKNTSSSEGRDFLASLFDRKNLKNNRLTSLLFASEIASLHEARDRVMLLLTKEDYGVLSYASDYLVGIKDKKGIAKISELICDKKLGVSEVINIGNIGEKWVIPLLKKIISARSNSKKQADTDCVAYSWGAIREIEKLD